MFFTFTLKANIKYCIRKTRKNDAYPEADKQFK